MTQVVETYPITDRALAKLRALEESGRLCLREGDHKEVLAFGVTPHTAIVKSIEASICSYITLADGELLATWGCVRGNPLAGVGHPWLLTTPLADSHKVFFARHSKRCVAHLETMFSRLEVFVAAEYLRAQAWLEWLGFNPPGTAIPLGDGTPFVYMYKEKK